MISGKNPSSSAECVPLLVPDMPSPQTLLPWLERMHAARHYSNFGPLVQALESEFACRFDLPPEKRNHLPFQMQYFWRKCTAANL